MKILGASSEKNNLTISFHNKKGFIENLQERQAKLKEQSYNKMSQDLSTSIIGTYTSLSQVKAASSLKTKIKGEAGELKTEIEVDKSRGASEASLKDKIEKLVGLNGKVEQMNEDIGKKLTDVNKDVSKSFKRKDDSKKTDGREVTGGDKTKPTITHLSVPPRKHQLMIKPLATSLKML